ncbi:MAG TPA: phenylacetic acid degradation protein PaaN [Gaiellaceae bacterium]|nr:phenylacetic acid degradation protein PaaN [Gaiellaceae bacterium]
MPLAVSDPALAEKHRALLDGARAAIRERTFWSAFPEHLALYGEDGAAAGKAAFEACLGREFPLDQPGADGTAGGERSPYGPELRIRYPHSATDALLAAAAAAIPAWRDAGADARTGACIEILVRLNERSHELAHAVMHTTGQGYPMAFQAGGPHAQDRGLEAIAYAWEEMSRHAPAAVWEKPQGKRPPLRLRKSFRIAPRGVALVIGCSTFPIWNAYPGLFASLVTGNAVVVKPSPRAVLPLALTVAVAREVLEAAGFDPNLVTLAVDADGERRAAELALRPEVRLIDYTGSSAFGEWLERNAAQAVVFAEKAGVNSAVLDSTDDYDGMLANLAFTLSLYSGQMCTTTQNLIVPRGGIETDKGHRSFDEVGADLAAAIDRLLAEPPRAAAILGAISSDEILARAERAGELGRLIRPSAPVEHPDFPGAAVRTPALVAVDGAADGPHLEEQFGPVAFLVAVDDTAAALLLLRETSARRGAITAAVWSTDEAVLAEAERAALEAGVALSENLAGGVYVNQSAAFSDFHATAANPAASASLTDGAFVAPRFHVVQSRRPLEEEA